MPRRVSLPGASELFRSTGTPERTDRHDPHAELRIADPPSDPTGADAEQQADRRAEVASIDTGLNTAAPDTAAASAAHPARAAARETLPGNGSGRVRHEEKITVYVSREELLALEEARLRLRAEFGLAIDRGRIVRQAISAAMADLAAHGPDSELVRSAS